MQVKSTFRGEFTNDEVLERLDEIFRRYENLTPRGIRVSNSMYQRGIAGNFRGIPIAMDQKLYPEDQIEIVFDDE
jgi:hypothetical protein